MFSAFKQNKETEDGKNHFNDVDLDTDVLFIDYDAEVTRNRSIVALTTERNKS